MEGQGTIVHISLEKGFGFIQAQGYEKNLFFHAKDMLKTKFDDLKKGDDVSFKEVVESAKGLSAKGIFI